MTRQVPKQKAEQKPKNKENDNYISSNYTIDFDKCKHAFLEIYTFLSLCPINPKGLKGVYVFPKKVPYFPRRH